MRRARVEEGDGAVGGLDHDAQLREEKLAADDLRARGAAVEPAEVRDRRRVARVVVEAAREVVVSAIAVAITPSAR